jgi:hypothetical protein
MHEIIVYDYKLTSEPIHAPNHELDEREINTCPLKKQCTNFSFILNIKTRHTFRFA